MMLWCYVPVLNIMLNLRSRIIHYRLIFAMMICKLHFIDLQDFIHKCPTTGSCQESHELILKLQRNVKIHFNITLPYMSVASALVTPYYPSKMLYLLLFSPCVVHVDFLDLFLCKYWLLRGIFFIVGPTPADMGALSVAMQQYCFQLYCKQSGHKIYSTY
jgi:hypothetical protein